MKSILKIATYSVALCSLFLIYLIDIRLYMIISMAGLFILVFRFIPELYVFLFPTVVNQSWFLNLKKTCCNLRFKIQIGSHRLSISA